MGDVLHELFYDCMSSSQMSFLHDKCKFTNCAVKHNQKHYLIVLIKYEDILSCFCGNALLNKTKYNRDFIQLILFATSIKIFFL